MLGKYIRCGLVWLVACGSAVAATTQTPDLNGGVWRTVKPTDELRTTKGQLPPLLPEARALYEKHRTAAKSGDRSFDITEQCKPPGLPRIYALPGAFEFLQRPEQIAIMYEWNRLMRLVDMNVPQPELIGPVYLGQSVGHWEGNTLVIDSIGFVGTTLLDGAGLPHSDKLHVVERFTVSGNGQQIKARFMIEDPAMYASTWETELQFKREPKGKIREDICLERKQIDWGKLK